MLSHVSTRAFRDRTHVGSHRVYVLVCMLGDATVALATVGVGPSNADARCVARSQ